MDRPSEVAEVVAALLRRHVKTVGITTALQGAGGFGKTTLALMVCADRRVRRRFKGFVYVVTIGREVQGGAAIAAKVNEVIKLVVGEDTAFTDPELAGQRLASLLDTGPRRLLVLDDVWELEQLTPFTGGGRRCARLVTTRVPGLVERCVPVRVDQMSPEQARRLLTSGLPPLTSSVVEGVLAATGRWPLLLRLVNKILANAAQTTADISVVGSQLLQRLKAAGPAAVDDYSLAVGQPWERTRAVRATIEASTSLLGPEDGERFAELGVFVEDETIPFSLAARLWRATAGLDVLQASQLSARMSELALVSAAGRGSGGLALHDVIGDFLRSELGPQRLARLHQVLLDTVAADLSASSPTSTSDSGLMVAWWELDSDDWYLWDHLIEHLLAAGRLSTAEAVASDLRWVDARLQRSGPTGPASDLSLVGTPRTARLLAVIERIAHLLTPCEPSDAIVDILHSLVADDPEWGIQAAALEDTYGRPRLVNRWRPSDLPISARRVLTGDFKWVAAATAAPDGSWLATGGHSGVQIWDPATGQERITFAVKGGGRNLAVAPDGSWLATGGFGGVVRIWDPVTGQERASFKVRPTWVNGLAAAPDGSWLVSTYGTGATRIWDVATGRVRTSLSRLRSARAVAIAPDGSWLAYSKVNGKIRIWDTNRRRIRVTLRGHGGHVGALAVAPDGSWLVSGGADKTVRIWDASTGQLRTILTGHTAEVNAVAVAPDGNWLASGGDDKTVRIWDVPTGQLLATLRGHLGPILAVTIARDGNWLASGGYDTTVRIWDRPTGEAQSSKRGLFEGDAGAVATVAAAPDGSWLVSGGADKTVRIWDASTGQLRTILTGHTAEVNAVAVAPDGSWLVSGGADKTVRIWDASTGQLRTILTGHTAEVNAVAVAPDGSWLVSGGADKTVRIWDASTGQLRATFKSFFHHSLGVRAVAVAPDGSWLVSGGSQEVWIRNAVSGHTRAGLSSLTRKGGGVAIAPDGSWLVTGGTSFVCIWDVAIRKPIWSRLRDIAKYGAPLIETPRTILKGHVDVVTTVAVSPDGRWLASGGEDGTLRIWNVATGQAVTLMRVDNAILECAWLGNKGLVIVGPAGLWTFNFLANDAMVPTGDHEG